MQYVNNVPVTKTNNIYLLLKIFKLYDIYSFFLITFHDWCCNIRIDMNAKIFVPLIPVQNYNVRINRLNYPTTRLNVHKQSTIFNV